MPTIKASDETAIIGAFIPPGVVQPFAGAAAPSGWLLCNGQAVSQTAYKALYDAIGVTWGNPGIGQFNLPDFRGVFPKGAGTTDRAAGKDSAGNAYAGTHTTYSTDKMQGHHHTKAYTDLYTGGGSLNYYQMNTRDVPNNPTPNLGDFVTDPSTNGTHGTPRTGYTTEPQSIGINYIIKY